MMRRKRAKPKGHVPPLNSHIWWRFPTVNSYFENFLSKLSPGDRWLKAVCPVVGGAYEEAGGRRQCLSWQIRDRATPPPGQDQRETTVNRFFTLPR